MRSVVLGKSVRLNLIFLKVLLRREIIYNNFVDTCDKRERLGQRQGKIRDVSVRIKTIVCIFLDIR